MTLILLLIRHAKSDWGDAARPDHQRPLNERGRRDAPRMGRWIAQQDLVPAEVLCSDAVRTRETLDLMLPAWAPPPRVIQRRELYHASPETMLANLAEVSADRVALVGHNPGIGELAGHLALEAPGHDRWDDYPTCAVAALSFDARDWSGIRPRHGKVVAFAVPADL
jgi:phosphohistidine phosphatase